MGAARVGQRVQATHLSRRRADNRRVAVRDNGGEVRGTIGACRDDCVAAMPLRSHLSGQHSGSTQANVTNRRIGIDATQRGRREYSVERVLAAHHVATLFRWPRIENRFHGLDTSLHYTLSQGWAQQGVEPGRQLQQLGRQLLLDTGLLRFRHRQGRSDRSGHNLPEPTYQTYPIHLTCLPWDLTSCLHSVERCDARFTALVQARNPRPNRTGYRHTETLEPRTDLPSGVK